MFEVFKTRRKKTKTLKGCAWSEATSVMHGYYQTAETRHTFLCQDSRYTSSVLCEDNRIQLIDGLSSMWAALILVFRVEHRQLYL